jgi:hypothetical protein
MPHIVPIPPPLFIAFMLVAAVLLAAWVYVRFERLGPRSLTGGFVALLAAFALISAVPSIIDGMIAAGIPGIRLVVVFGLGLPVFTYFFLAGGWLMRSVLRLPGHFN